MQRRTPIKVRSKRDKFLRLDEIPTKDNTPNFDHIGRRKNSSWTVRDQVGQRPIFRRAISLDFTSNSSGSEHRRRHSEQDNVVHKSSKQRQTSVNDFREILSGKVHME